MIDPIPADSQAPVKWADLPYTFKRICAIKGTIVKLSLLSEANQAAYEAGTLVNLQESIMEDAYCLVDLADRPDLPDELKPNPIRVELCVYDLGVYKTNLVEEDKPRIQGFWNIPWMAFSQGALNTDFVGDEVILIYCPEDADTVPIIDRLILVGHSDSVLDNKYNHINFGAGRGLLSLPVKGGLDSYIRTHYFRSAYVEAWFDLYDIVVYKNGYLYRFPVVTEDTRTLGSDTIFEWPYGIEPISAFLSYPIEILYSNRNYHKAYTETTAVDASYDYYSYTYNTLTVGVAYLRMGPRLWDNPGPDYYTDEKSMYSEAEKVVERSQVVGTLDMNNKLFTPFYPHRYRAIGTYDPSTRIYTMVFGFPLEYTGLPSDGETYKVTVAPVYDADGEIEDFTIEETVGKFSEYTTTATTSVASSSSGGDCIGGETVTVSTTLITHDSTVTGKGLIAEVGGTSLVCSINDSSSFLKDEVVTSVSSGFDDPSDCSGSAASTIKTVEQTKTADVSVDRVYSIEYSDGFVLDIGSTTYTFSLSRVFNSSNTISDPVYRPIPGEEATFEGKLIYFLGMRLCDGVCFFVEVIVDNATATYPDIYEFESTGQGPLVPTTARLELKAVINRQVITIDTISTNKDGGTDFYLGNVWADLFWDYSINEWPAVRPKYASEHVYFDKAVYTTESEPVYTRPDGTSTYKWHGSIFPPHTLDYILYHVMRQFSYFSRARTDYVYTTENTDVEQRAFAVGSMAHAMPIILRVYDDNREDARNALTSTIYWDHDHKVMTFWTPDLSNPGIGRQLFFINNELVLNLTDHEFFNFEYKKIA